MGSEMPRTAEATESFEPPYAALVQFELAQFGLGNDDRVTAAVSRLMLEAYDAGRAERAALTAEEPKEAAPVYVRDPRGSGMLARLGSSEATKRCESETTLCFDEHQTYRCALDVGHSGEHQSGDGTCSWTDVETRFDGKPSKVLRPDDTSEDAATLRSVAYYLRMWCLDGDAAWHSVSHVRALVNGDKAEAVCAFHMRLVEAMKDRSTSPTKKCECTRDGVCFPCLADKGEERAIAERQARIEAGEFK
jgi:hypothetical protein